MELLLGIYLLNMHHQFNLILLVGLEEEQKFKVVIFKILVRL